MPIIEGVLVIDFSDFLGKCRSGALLNKVSQKIKEKQLYILLEILIITFRWT